MCVHSEVRVFVNDTQLTHLNVKDESGNVIFDEEINFPFKAEDQPYNQNDSSFPHSYKFYNNGTDEHQYRIDAGQNPVFYVSGSIRRHFTSFPSVSQATVTIEDPDTGDVYLSTTTSGDGGFEVISSQLPENMPELVKVNIKGGSALGRTRHPGNVMASLVRSDSFQRGSVTISMSSTAAYLALAERKGEISDIDYLNVYKHNSNVVTRGFYPDVSEYPFESSYLNVNDETVLTEAYSIDMREFFTRKILNTEQTLMDLMFTDPEDQREGLSIYFSRLEGWTHVNDEHLTSRPLNIRILGLGQLELMRYRQVEFPYKEITHEEILVSNSLLEDYYHPQLLIDDDELVRIKITPADGWALLSAHNCLNNQSLVCEPKHKAKKVSIVFYELTDDQSSINDYKYFDYQHFNFNNGVFTGKASSSPTDV
jgi:hypothetical protein